MKGRKGENVSKSIVQQQNEMWTKSQISIEGSSHDEPPRSHSKVFKGTGGREFDMSLFKNVPGWESIITEGFTRRSYSSSPTTIYTEFNTLRKLVPFLIKSNRLPLDVDESFWASMLSWLNSSWEGGDPLAPRTRQQYFQIFKLTIKATIKVNEFREEAEHILFRSGIPSNPWPGAKRKVDPTEVLTAEGRSKVILACLTEIERIRVCVEEQEKRHPDEEGSYCASNDDLVPFVVLLAIITAFNSSTVLKLEWSNIVESHDGMTISLTGVKARAGRAQTSTHDSDLCTIRFPAEAKIEGGLKNILKLLRDITMRARNYAETGEKDFLFLFMHGGERPKASSFVSHEGLEARITPRAFKSFQTRYKLPKFDLSTLRATEAEVTFQTTRDILAVSDRLGHKHAQITRTHYTSGWVQRSGQEQIGLVQELVVRWSKTDGLIDPRGLKDPRDAPSATRGFGCIDPYDSPRQGQVKGRLCAAYGECPSCPLMLARPNDLQSVAYFLALKKAIVAGKAGIGTGGAWAERWLPVLTDLEALLAEIPISIIADAKELRVTLPPVA